MDISGVSIMHSENDYEKIAKEALSKYSIIPEQIVYLGKSDNGAFRVNSIDEASSYLIKLHYSTTGSRSKEHIESELIWLEVLARDSSLVIPVPVKNSEGELVTTVWMDGS
jgi:Ser/Thr protein kinase RdoA (MazF antagonist)